MPRASIRVILGSILILVWSLNIWLTGPRLDLILVLIILIVATVLTVLEWRKPPREGHGKVVTPHLFWVIGAVLGVYAIIQLFST